MTCAATGAAGRDGALTTGVAAATDGALTTAGVVTTVPLVLAACVCVPPATVVCLS